jgi:hypothetical protein
MRTIQGAGQGAKATVFATMAAQAPARDQSYGYSYDAYPLAPVGTLLGIACITTGLRIYWRVHPVRRIGPDDYALLFALVRTLAHHPGLQS